MPDTRRGADPTKRSLDRPLDQSTSRPVERQPGRTTPGRDHPTGPVTPAGR
jgi:hypothetical protein